MEAILQAQLSVLKSDLLNDGHRRIDLIQASSKFGCIFVASDSVINILFLNCLEDRFDSGESVQNINELSVLQLNFHGPVGSIQLSPSETMLAVSFIDDNSVQVLDVIAVLSQKSQVNQ